MTVRVPNTLGKYGILVIIGEIDRYLEDVCENRQVKRTPGRAFASAQSD